MKKIFYKGSNDLNEVLEDLRDSLVGEEMNCIEFDNSMMKHCYTEFELINDENLESGVLVYCLKEDPDIYIRVEFEVTITNGEDEDATASYIKVNDISLN